MAGVLTLALSATVVAAATTDFVANGNITVSGVTYSAGTADMLIMSGSKAESWNFTSGVFTVTNPDATSGFKVGSADSSVISLRVKDSGGTEVSCNPNDPVGTSSVSLPTTSGTYTVVPSANACGGGGSSGGGGGGGGGGGAVTQPPTVTPPTIIPPVTLPPTADERAQQVIAILQEASQVAGASRDDIAAAVGAARDQGLEQRYDATLVARVVLAGTPAADRAHVLSFVTYGTPTTVGLGAGERAGVVNSFRAAFGHVPSSEADWGDVIKIANGRFPSVTNAGRETAMNAVFKKIYLRNPNRANSHDDAAITVMAYGLRTGVRNLGSEGSAIKSFKAIFGHGPTSASDWDAVRAVAYSGATR